MTDSFSAKGFDFHCHIDLYPSPEQMIQSCEKERIVTFAVTTTPKAWPQNLRWTAQSRYVYAAIGLHPELVEERHDEIELLEEYMKETRLVGEVGLDGSPRYKKSWKLQIEVFIRALICAQNLGGRVISIHSRSAYNDVLKLLEEHTSPDRVLPVLHWFSGSKAATKKAVSLGCYFSINHKMLEYETGLELVRNIPTERLLTETDAPFTSKGDRKSIPADAIETAKYLAKVRGIPIQKFNKVLETNAHHVFSFAGIDYKNETKKEHYRNL